ncbi:MAG: hypothetical protein Q9169_002412 [Polycauliona sp. 2 TL-2023]
MNLLNPFWDSPITIRPPNAALVLSTLTFGAFVVLIVQRFTSPLRKVPGPWTAVLTDLWRLRNALSGREQMIWLELHEKYGPVVRTGPNMVLVNDPEPLSTLHRWDRSRGLDAFFKLTNVSMLSGDADMRAHNKLKHAFRRPLSLSSVLDHETAMDQLIERWFQKLTAQHGHGEVCDLSPWIDLITPDVTAALLWSKPIGLIEKGADFAGMVYGAAEFRAIALIPLVFPWVPAALVSMGISSVAQLFMSRVKSVSFMSELAQIAVDDAAERKDGRDRGDIVQSLVDYRDRDGNRIPKERLYGEVQGLM